MQGLTLNDKKKKEKRKVTLLNWAVNMCYANHDILPDTGGEKNQPKIHGPQELTLTPTS